VAKSANNHSLKTMSRTDKVAILLISLGEDLAAELIQKLPQAEAKRVLQAISSMRNVDEKIIAGIQEEFQSLLLSFKQSIPQGTDAARRIIMKAFGPEQAAKFNEALPPALPQCFQEAESVDGKTLWQILRIEHPQTIALILGHLSAKKAGELAKEMPPLIRGDILARLAGLNEIDSSVLEDIDEILSKAINQAKHRSLHRIGGPGKAAAILAQMGSEQRKDLLEKLEGGAPALAAEVRSGLFTFDDIQKFDRRGMEKLLSVIPQSDLELALRRLSDDLANQFFSAMSARRAEQLRENIAAAKPSSVTKIDEAQRRIAALAAQLVENGDIRDPQDEVA
jgi:flagellar motor switch protein FliG